MFDIKKKIRKIKNDFVASLQENIIASITAEAFGGFFNFFNNASKDFAIASVYTCVRIISQTIATSPIRLYKENESGDRVIQKKHKLSKLFKNPYGFMTLYNWVQFMSMSLAARGNAYAYIVRDMEYNPIELIPLKWDDVSIMEVMNSNDFFYRVNFENKTINIWHEDMLHFKLMSEDGKSGINPIELHRTTIDNSKNESTYIENFYKQASNISGVIESPKSLDKAAVSEIKDSFASNFGGVANVGKTAVLSGGKTYKQLKLLSPMDANYIETAKLSRADVATIFGVPLYKLGDMSQATFGNLSEMNRDFYKTTILPYYTCIAQELDIKLLTSDEQDEYFFDFNEDVLLRASKKERYEEYNLGIEGGYILPNEARAAENLKKIDGLDEPMQKSGMLTKSQADNNFKNNGGDTQNENSNEDTNSALAALNKHLIDLKSEVGRLKALHIKSSDETSTKKDKDDK